MQNVSWSKQACFEFLMAGGTAELNPSVLNHSVLAGVNGRNTGHVCALCFCCVYQNLLKFSCYPKIIIHYDSKYVIQIVMKVVSFWMWNCCTCIICSVGLCQELMVSYHTIYSHYVDPYRITKSVWI